LIDVDHAECGIEHELHFVAQERGVATHLFDIARRGLEAATHVTANVGLAGLQQENK
jgi:hypothetical protein